MRVPYRNGIKGNMEQGNLLSPKGETLAMKRRR